MRNTPSFSELRQYGFDFGPHARMFANSETMAACVRDAALVTTPNTAVPAEFLAYIDPLVIDILTAPRNATEIFSESRKGDWATSYEKWRVNELTGRTQPYDDRTSGSTSGVNYNWMTRQQYRFQTVIQYGDLEADMSSAAKINLAADKQRAAAHTVAVDANRFYLLGVDGLEIYGILNDPNLPNAILAADNGSGSTAWADKTTLQIYEDVLALFAQLVSQSRGLITRDAPLVLAVSPETAVYLAAATNYNVHVTDMLDKYFRSLTIVPLPELTDLPQGEAMFLIATEVMGQPSGSLAFGEKFRAGRLIPELSSLKQKYSSSTYGGIVHMPFAFAEMIGIGG